jgi:hypothetical protein
MVTFIVKPPEPSRPCRAGKTKLGWLYPLRSKALTRLFQPARFFAKFGRVVSLTQQGFYPPLTTGRPTDVCHFRAA